MNIIRNLIISFAFLAFSSLAANATNCGTGTGTCFWIPASGAATWAATTNWSNSSGGATCTCAPTTGDAVTFDASSGTNTSTLGASISLASFTATNSSALTISHSAAVTMTITGNTWAMGSNVTYTLGNTGTSALSFTSTSGTTAITTAGKKIGNITFNGVGGTFQLQDNFVGSSTSTPIVTLTAGTFDMNNHNVNAGSFSSTNGSARTLTMGSGTMTLGATGTIFTVSAASTLTLTANTGTLTFLGTSGLITFVGGSLTTYGTLNIPANQVGFQIQGNNTFSNVNVTAPAYVQINGSSTQTITNAFTWAGTSGNEILVTGANSAQGTIHASAAGSTLAWAGLNAIVFTTNAVSATNSFDFGNNNMNGGSITPPSGGGGTTIVKIIGG